MDTCIYIYNFLYWHITQTWLLINGSKLTATVTIGPLCIPSVLILSVYNLNKLCEHLMIQSTGYLELCLFLLLTDWMPPWKEKDCWHLKKKKLKKKQRKGTCSCTYSKINAVIVFVFRKLLKWQNQVLKLEGTMCNSVTV